MKKITFILAALFLIGATLHAQTNLTNASGSFRRTIATSDSAVRLTATGTTSKYVIVQALPSNAGRIAVGVTKGRITAASVDTPIVLVSASHGLATGQRISIVGVQGNTAANGSWPVTVISADTLTIDSAAGNAAYYRGGIWTDVSTTAGYERGDQLRAGGSTVLIVDDVSQVWINGTAGDGVIWRYGLGLDPTPPIEGGSKQADSSIVLLSGVATKIKQDTSNAALGRIEGLLPAGIGTASDTLNGPYNATAYAAYDIKQDSTAKWLVFNIAASAGVLINASATADTANTSGNVRRLLIVADTTGWGVLTADNAQFALTPAKAGKVIGEIVFAMKTEGTGSTAAYRSVEVRQWFRTVTNQKLFGLVVMDGAYTGKKAEVSTFTLTFIKQN